MKYARWMVVVMALAMTAFAGWRLYVQGREAGRAEVQQAWDKAALKTSEAVRKHERQMKTAMEGLDRELQQQKSRNAALSRAHAERLREFEAINDRRAADSAHRAPEDVAAASGADGPFAAIAGECARALVALDEHARGLAQTAAGLQKYATSVCVSQDGLHGGC